MQNLPGYELIEKGLLDISLNRESYFTALLYSAESKLAKLGINLGGLRPPDAVSQMYGFLQSEFGDGAHSKFNALNRRLISFCKSLEHQIRVK